MVSAYTGPKHFVYWMILLFGWHSMQSNNETLTKGKKKKMAIPKRTTIEPLICMSENEKQTKTPKCTRVSMFVNPLSYVQCTMYN